MNEARGQTKRRLNITLGHVFRAGLSTIADSKEPEGLHRGGVVGLGRVQEVRERGGPWEKMNWVS